MPVRYRRRRSLRSIDAIYPGAARWIIGEAGKNAEHTRAMEARAVPIQRTDMLLHRLLPFGLVLVFVAVSVGLAFLNPAAGAAGLAITIGGVVIAYLTGRTPGQPTEDDEDR